MNDLDSIENAASLDEPLSPESSEADAQGRYDHRPAQLLINRHAGLRYPYHCVFGQAKLEIAEGVFCPTLTKASPLLLEAVTFAPGQRVLDVFSGSGAFAINAALTGADAVAVDISPRAATCARRNVALNHVTRHAEIRLGTMKSCVAKAEVFDVIVANPPLLPSDGSEVKEDLVQAIYDPGFEATLSFMEEVGHHLSANSRAYLVTSDVLDRYCYDVDRLCFDNGLTGTLVSKLDVGYETYRVHMITCR